MKTVRFSNVVQKCGAPEVYLLLLDPKKDPAFQQALKAGRVMTLQTAKGAKTDFGTVGYLPDARGQILLFPRSLKSFAEAHIVGINYDLLKQEPSEHRKAPAKKTPAPEKPRAEPRPAKKSGSEKPAPVAMKKPVVLPSPKKERPSPAEKVIPFTKAEPEEDEDDETVAEIKADIRRAMKALEAGKQVAAFNILKRVVE